MHARHRACNLQQLRCALCVLLPHKHDEKPRVRLNGCTDISATVTHGRPAPEAGTSACAHLMLFLNGMYSPLLGIQMWWWAALRTVCLLSSTVLSAAISASTACVSETSMHRACMSAISVHTTCTSSETTSAAGSPLSGAETGSTWERELSQSLPLASASDSEIGSHGSWGNTVGSSGVIPTREPDVCLLEAETRSSESGLPPELRDSRQLRPRGTTTDTCC